MVEISEAEKKKELKEMRTTQGPLGQCEMIIGVPEEEDKKKGHENILEEIIAENFPKMGKEIVTKAKKPRESQTG